MTLALLAWAVAALMFVLFAHLGGEVGEGETAGFDDYVLHVAQSLRSAHPMISAVMRDFSGVSAGVVLALITAASCGYLVIAREQKTALLLGMSVVTGSGAVALLKSMFGRARPPPNFAEFAASGLSFPSGHTSMSAVVFLTLGPVVARSQTRR